MAALNDGEVIFIHALNPADADIIVQDIHVQTTYFPRWGEQESNRRSCRSHCQTITWTRRTHQRRNGRSKQRADKV